MAHGKSGRPRKEDLQTTRCIGRNHQNAPCGNPALPGERHCVHHAPRLDAATTTVLVERLRAMANPALDRLLEIIKYGKDGDANVAIRTLMDRLAPKPGTLNAVVISTNGGEGGDQAEDMSAQIRRRLVEMRPDLIAKLEARAEPSPSSFHAGSAYSTPARGEADNVVDAEIIEEPIPVAAQDIPESEPEADPRLAPGETWEVEPAFGVPGVRRRAVNLVELAARVEDHPHIVPRIPGGIFPRG